MAAVNYRQPKPVDPIFYRRTCYIRVRCACGRAETEVLGEFARKRGVPGHVRIYEMLTRLRCRRCGRTPTAEVTLYRGGD